MFHVGQKVVCVDDKTSTARHKNVVISNDLLKKGVVYTVSGLDIFKNSVLVSTAETDHYFSPGYGGWLSRRFRPVHTTDISIFEAMLVPTPKEKVEA